MKSKEEPSKEDEQTILQFYGTREVLWKNKKFERRVVFVGVKSDNKLRIGISECCNGPRIHDQFVKEVGRTIAKGRAIKKPIVIIDLNDDKYKDKKLNIIFLEACKMQPNIKPLFKSKRNY